MSTVQNAAASSSVAIATKKRRRLWVSALLLVALSIGIGQFLPSDDGPNVVVSSADSEGDLMASLTLDPFAQDTLRVNSPARESAVNVGVSEGSQGIVPRAPENIEFQAGQSVDEMSQDSDSDSGTVQPRGGDANSAEKAGEQAGLSTGVTGNGEGAQGGAKRFSSNMDDFITRRFPAFPGSGNGGGELDKEPSTADAPKGDLLIVPSNEDGIIVDLGVSEGATPDSNTETTGESDDSLASNPPSDQQNNNGSDWHPNLPLLDDYIPDSADGTTGGSSNSPTYIVSEPSAFMLVVIGFLGLIVAFGSRRRT